jgi:hypothetical protein
MCMYVYSMFVWFCVSIGLGMSWSLIQGVLPYMYKRLRNRNRRPRPGKGCRATGKEEEQNKKRNQHLNTCMDVCYLDCHKAGLCSNLMIHIEDLLRSLQLFFFNFWSVYWLSLILTINNAISCSPNRNLILRNAPPLEMTFLVWVFARAHVCVGSIM